MEAIAGGAERGPVVSATIAASALVVLGLTVAADLPVAEVSMAVAGLVALALCYRTALRWHSMLAGMLLVIMFVPIKRYGLPGNLPFDLEPYRVVVALIATGWIISLLVDPRVRLRASGLEAPLAMIGVTALASVLVNGERVDTLKVGPEVIKGLMFLVSFMLVFYLIVSVVRTFGHIHLLVKLTTACGGFVAFCSIVEARTGWNAFDHLASLIPLLSPQDVVGNMSRGGRLRVYGSAQGAIPLGAALAFLVPMGVYMARSSTRRWLWLGVVGLLLLGTLATGSRTGVIMLLVELIVFLCLRPKETARALWVALLPALVVIHIALPGAIGSLQSSFFPEGGLIAQQSQNAGWRGSGRIADLGPAMEEFIAQPLLGQGYSTRITGRVRANAQILDDQWLKTLLETGVAGVFGWLWLFVRFARRLGPAAKADRGDRGWLLTAFVAAVTAFAFGKFFFDAFAFIQATILLYVVLALGVCLLAARQHEPVRARVPRAAARRRPAMATPARGATGAAPWTP